MKYILISFILLVSAGYCAKPNIIIILADDLGYADVGYHGCKDIPTPHIDSIATNGVQFSTGYAAAPVCGPSRAGLLTGRYQNRFGYQDNIGPYGRNEDTKQGTPLSIKTIGDRFKELGYKTAMIGKWHDGDEDQFWPHNRGFDYTYCFNNGAANYFVGPVNNKGDKWGAIHRNGQRLDKAGEYLTDVFGDEAAAYVKRNKDTAFLLYLSFNAVHGPLQATDYYKKKFKHIKDIKRRLLAAMNYAMDINIGKLLTALKETKLEEKTLVFFYSDNGGKPNGNASYNKPLRSEKGTTWEGGIRVPFCVQWKGTINPGQSFADPVHAIDIMQTAVAATGQKAPVSWELEGYNLMPLMTGKVKELEDRHLFWRLNTNWAVRNNTWKLTGMNGRVALFKISEDISESKDLIKEFPEIAQKLKTELAKWDKANEPARWGWNKNVCAHFIGYRQWKTEQQFLDMKNRKHKKKK